jgi:hypothetical protein
MYILMIGSPYDGFELFGPYVSEEAATLAIRHFRGRWRHQWIFELNTLLEDPIEEEDPAGTAVVFSGSLGDPWGFYGPFKDLNAAEWWAWKEGPGFSDCAIELRPVKEHELETA